MPGFRRVHAADEAQLGLGIPGLHARGESPREEGRLRVIEGNVGRVERGVPEVAGSAYDREANRWVLARDLRNGRGETRAGADHEVPSLLGEKPE